MSFNPFDNIKPELVLATKDLVDRLLDCNQHNRHPKQSHISKLSQEIKTGNWFLTAQGIGVSKSNILLDGQHRLMAIKDAGYPPVPLLIVYGLDDASQIAVDRHAKRSMADVLTLLINRTISTQYVAAINGMIEIKNSLSKNDQFFCTKKIMQDTEVSRMTEEWADEAELILPAIGSVRATITAAVMIYAAHDKDKAVEFAHQLKTGTNLSEDDPAYRLRMQIATIKDTGQMSRVRFFKITVSAIIAHASGRKIKLLKESSSWSEFPYKWKL